MSKQLSVLAALALLLSAALAGVATAGGSGLAAWWKLDETSGLTAADASGNDNDGALEGDGQWVEGVLAGAWEGDGDGDYIRVAHSDSLDISDAVTVALWMYGGIAPDQILCKGTGGDAWVSSYSIRVDDDSSHARQINWRGRGGTAANGLNSASALPTDEWVHIAVTFDVAASGDNQKIYINGVLDAENQSSEPLSTNAEDLLLGADAYGTTRWHWQGRLDDVRVYSKALPASQIAGVMAGGGLESASSPSPEDGAIDVPRDTVLAWQTGEYAATHDVYFGTSREDVNSADRNNPLDVLVSQGQAANAYASDGLLEFGTTYYWRVDEVNAAPDNTIFSGEVWSFTAEPLAYPLENVTATTNAGYEAGAGPENTINGSGLNADDQHSTKSTDMFLAQPGAEPIYLQYEFDQVYKLHELIVWNYNSQFELLLGFGVQNVTIEYSENGADWASLGDVDLNQATGQSTYVANTVIDLAGVAARYVKLTVSSGFGSMGKYGLSEVRFMYIPAQAREPEPADGATDVDVTTMLTWRAGRDSIAHEVAFGTDPDALAPAGTVETPSLDPGELDLSVTYYWQVTEVQDTEAWTGPLWSFAAQSYLVVDDFESYNDDDNVIYETWLDGWVNDTGSTVGYFEEPFAEQTIVHSGRQSMPLFYDNAAGSVSEADLELTQDWTTNGIKSLSLHFYGDVDNTAAQLYVTINNTRVDYVGSSADLTDPNWHRWSIDLSTAGNVSNVRSLTIGIEGSGASGVVYVDDIRLYPYVVDYLATDVTAPDDLVVGVPNDGDWPDAETPDLAIDDDTATKFLHFKGFSEPTGIQVTPAAGTSIVTGLSFTTANDATERDPVAFELYGSNDSIDGPYTLIAGGEIADFAQATAWPRFTKNETPITFDNDVAYTHYQLLLTAVRDPASANSMQIAEIELLGTMAN